MSQKPFSRSVYPVGGSETDSLGSTLPKALLERHGVQEGDEIPISVQDGDVTFHVSDVDDADQAAD